MNWRDKAQELLNQGYKPTKKTIIDGKHYVIFEKGKSSVLLEVPEITYQLYDLPEDNDSSSNNTSSTSSSSTSGSSNSYSYTDSHSSEESSGYTSTQYRSGTYIDEEYLRNYYKQLGYSDKGAKYNTEWDKRWIISEANELLNEKNVSEHIIGQWRFVKKGDTVYVYLKGRLVGTVTKDYTQKTIESSRNKALAEVKPILENLGAKNIKFDYVGQRIIAEAKDSYITVDLKNNQLVYKTDAGIIYFKINKKEIVQNGKRVIQLELKPTYAAFTGGGGESGEPVWSITYDPKTNKYILSIYKKEGIKAKTPLREIKQDINIIATGNSISEVLQKAHKKLKEQTEKVLNTVARDMLAYLKKENPKLYNEFITFAAVNNLFPANRALKPQDVVKAWFEFVKIKTLPTFDKWKEPSTGSITWDTINKFQNWFYKNVIVPAAKVLHWGKDEQDFAMGLLSGFLSVAAFPARFIEVGVKSGVKLAQKDLSDFLKTWSSFLVDELGRGMIEWTKDKVVRALKGKLTMYDLGELFGMYIAGKIMEPIGEKISEKIDLKKLAENFEKIIQDPQKKRAMFNVYRIYKAINGGLPKEYWKKLIEKLEKDKSFSFVISELKERLGEKLFDFTINKLKEIKDPKKRAKILDKIIKVAEKSRDIETELKNYELVKDKLSESARINKLKTVLKDIKELHETLQDLSKEGIYITNPKYVHWINTYERLANIFKIRDPTKLAQKVAEFEKKIKEVKKAGLLERNINSVLDVLPEDVQKIEIAYEIVKNKLHKKLTKKEIQNLIKIGNRQIVKAVKVLLDAKEPLEKLKAYFLHSKEIKIILNNERLNNLLNNLYEKIKKDFWRTPIEKMIARKLNKEALLELTFLRKYSNFGPRLTNTLELLEQLYQRGKIILHIEEPVRVKNFVWLSVMTFSYHPKYIEQYIKLAETLRKKLSKELNIYVPISLLSEFYREKDKIKNLLKNYKNLLGKDQLIKLLYKYPTRVDELKKNLEYLKEAKSLRNAKTTLSYLKTLRKLQSIEAQMTIPELVLFVKQKIKNVKKQMEKHRNELKNRTKVFSVQLSINTQKLSSITFPKLKYNVKVSKINVTAPKVMSLKLELKRKMLEKKKRSNQKSKKKTKEGLLLLENSVYHNVTGLILKIQNLKKKFYTGLEPR